jgi:5-methylcytosine-specific restriction protein A
MPIGPRNHQPSAGNVHRPATNPRGTRKQRGYGEPWQRLRAEHIAGSPLCVECLKEGLRVLATDVDHVTPFKGLDDPLRLDPRNLQSLCKSHHSAKTAREDGGFGRPKIGG